MPKPDSPPGHDRHNVDVVVNGVVTTVAIHGNPTLAEIIAIALDQTQNTGQPAENWELRGPDSTPLVDLNVKIKTLDLDVDAKLYLNLRAGVGGGQ
jgi:hypothetical protein